MARIYGLNGALRGKQGNNVFSIQNGTQIVKAYQPVVANPRTFPQIRQRSKFALAGKMSAIVPNGALVGITGSNARARRAAFVSAIAKAATFSSVGSELVASVATNNVIFSVGSLPRYSVVNTTSAAYQGQDENLVLHVTLTGHTADPVSPLAPAGYGELVVVCMYDPTGSRLDACQYGIRGDATMTFDFRVTQRSGALVAFYICPFCPVDGADSLRSVGNLYPVDSNVSLNMGMTEFAAGYRWGNSVNITNRTVAPVTTMVAPEPADDTRKRK